VRPDRAGAAVYTAPWRLVDAPEIENCPVSAAGLGEDQIETGSVPHSLTTQQNIATGAFHEAGHALIYRAVGIAVTGVTFTTSGQAARGHTSFGDDDHHPLPYWIAGHLAGQVAAELYLERDNAAETGNLVITHLQAAHDYEQLFHMRAERPLILYYGSSGHPPTTSAIHVDIDAMRQATGHLLEDVWPALGELADHLRTHGAADPGLLAALPYGRLTRDAIDRLFAGALPDATRQARAGSNTTPA
jgi:hypothetical protein